MVHCATMLHSLITQQSAPVHIHFVCSDGLPAAAVAPLEQMVERLGGEFTVRTVSRRDLGDLGELQVAAPFYRVVLPDVLSDLDRVLYLDCDLIVTDSLAPLLAIDLSSHWIGAVNNGFLSTEWGERHCSGLGLPSGQRYFNSGVLLMNLRSLREDGCVERIREHVRTHPGARAAALRLEGSPGEFGAYIRDHPGEMLFWEQDSLNAVLGHRRLELDPRWNFMNAFRFPAAREPFGERALARARKHPAIRHFEGVAEQKPWHPGTDVEDRELYWRHRRQTPWG
jgi:lipopolysaccharide biosynthesis glycosyltransferase